MKWTYISLVAVTPQEDQHIGHLLQTLGDKERDKSPDDWFEKQSASQTEGEGFCQSTRKARFPLYWTLGTEA